MNAGTVGCISPRPVSPQMIPTIVQQSQPTNNPHISVTPPSKGIQEQNGMITPNENRIITYNQNGIASPHHQVRF